MTRHVLVWTAVLAWGLWACRDELRRTWRRYRRGREPMQRSARAKARADAAGARP